MVICEYVANIEKDTYTLLIWITYNNTPRCINKLS